MQRTVSTVVLWGVIVGAVWSENAALCFWLVGAAALVSLWEFLNMVAPVNEARRYRVWDYVVSVAFLAGTYAWCRGTGQEAPFWIDAAAVALVVQGAFVVTFFSEIEGRKTLERIFACIFGFLYVVVLASFLVRILYLKGADGETGGVAGIYLVVYVLAVTKFTDMGAYVVGSMIGKHKMIPHISPKKTWQGFGGALLFAQLASVLMIALFPERLVPVTLGHGAVLALLLGVWAVCGDLAESILKRCFGVKDSGNSLPGIGGVLDLVDSVLYTAPVFYFYYRFVLV